MNRISEMLVTDVKMLGPVMEYWINWEFYATLFITMYHRRIHLMTKETDKYLPHPDGLTCSLNNCLVLCLSWIECNWYLLPAVPRNYCWSYVEDAPNFLFLSDGLPAQFASVKPWSFTPSVRLYHNPYSVVPLRYLKTCFLAFQKILVGLTIAWLSWLNV